MAAPHLDQVKELAKALKQACALFSFPADILQKKKAQFIYELLCYFTFVKDLRNITSLAFLPGVHNSTFPEGPAKKTNYAYFTVTLQDGATLDICHGTRIVDIYGENRAPDISIQDNSHQDDPSHESLHAIFDAKYRTHGEESSVSDNEFAKFILFMDVLHIAKPAPGDILDQIAPASFAVCSLLTNGNKPTEPKQHLLDKGISVVEHFNGVPASVPWPDRDAHLKHALPKLPATPPPPTEMTLENNQRADG